MKCQHRPCHTSSTAPLVHCGGLDRAGTPGGAGGTVDPEHARNRPSWIHGSAGTKSCICIYPSVLPQRRTNRSVASRNLPSRPGTAKYSSFRCRQDLTTSDFVGGFVVRRTNEWVLTIIGLRGLRGRPNRPYSTSIIPVGDDMAALGTFVLSCSSAHKRCHDQRLAD